MGEVEAATILATAAALRRQGRFAEALTLYERATRSLPDVVASWSGFADCLAAARYLDRALAAWDHLLRLRPGLPHALCAKATIQLGRGQTAEAEALFAETLKADRHFPAALVGLARIAFDEGRLEAAAALLAPLRVGGRLDVGWLSAQIAIGQGELGEADSAMTAMLCLDLQPDQRAELLLSHGDVLGQLDRPAEAFAAAVAGKALQRRIFAERAAGRESETAKLDRLATFFASAERSSWQPAPSLARQAREARAHVFLVGFPRSGTTLLEQVLAGHPDVRALEEAPTLAAHYAEFLSSDVGCERLAELSAAEADAWRQRYWDVVRANGIDATGRLFLDKAPAGTLSLPLVAKLFPDARILFAVRDPRAVVLSCLRSAFQMNAMTYAFTSLAETAACYDACMRLASVYRERLPLALTEVRHETLVDDFDGEIARITSFLGLAPHAAMHDVAATTTGRPVRTPSARQVRAGVNRHGLLRWRSFVRELAPVLPVLAPWVEHFGYPLD